MKNQRPIASLLVMLIAFACVCGTQFVRAEGPFDVDNATGGGKTRPTSTINNPPPDDPSGDDGMVGTRVSAAIIGGDWFSGLILRVSLDYICDRLIVVKATAPKQTPASVIANRDR